MMNIEIFGKDQCPFCTQAITIAEETEGASYVYKKLGEDFTREELFEIFPTARTFPQIKVNGKVVGGFVDFKEYIKDNV